MTPRWLMLIVFLGALGCAGGETEIASSDTGVVDTSEDTGTGLDTAPTVDTVEDVDASSVCSPAEDPPTCVDASTLRQCKSDRTGFEEVTCSSGTACTQGECVALDPICEPGATSCVDLRTELRCASDGLTEAEASCINGRCVDGACNPGGDTGESCTQDSQCAGKSCLCLDGGCGSVSEGYCSTVGCDVNGCDRDEICIDLALGEAEPELRCVKDCSDCSAAGFACGTWPTGVGEEMTWTDACFYERDLKPVGATCTSDEECLGGICLTASPTNALIEGGYCTSPCEVQANCPGASSCVQIPGYQDDQSLCLLSCVDANEDGNATECPPERPADGFNIVCEAERALDLGTTLFVCFHR